MRNNPLVIYNYIIKQARICRTQRAGDASGAPVAGLPWHLWFEVGIPSGRAQAQTRLARLKGATQNRAMRGRMLSMPGHHLFAQLAVPLDVEGRNLRFRQRLRGGDGDGVRVGQQDCAQHTGDAVGQRECVRVATAGRALGVYWLELHKARQWKWAAAATRGT